MLISMRFSGSSSSGASSGITTTGLMCSARAEARRKLGGPWWGGVAMCGSCSRHPLQEAPSVVPGAHRAPPGTRDPLSAQGGNKAAAWGSRGYLGQPRDLDEPLEVEHVRGSAEEVSEAMRAGEGRSRWSQVRPGNPGSSGPRASPCPGCTCETAHGTGPCGLAGCQPGDLRAVMFDGTSPRPPAPVPTLFRHLLEPGREEREL